MKTRNGFVSNSSSSSFVIVGIKLEARECDVEKVEKLKLDYDYLEGEGCFIVGKELSRWSSDSNGGVKSIDINELQKIAGELTQKLTKLDIEEPQKLQIFFGETY